MDQLPLRAETHGTNDAQLAAIFAVSKLAESRDEAMGKHLERTQSYCRLLAGELLSRGKHGDAVDPEFIDTIHHASPLHDIGKIAVPDGVLCKPGKLTDTEFEIIKAHTLRGAETLQEVADHFPDDRFIAMSIDIARSHHEKWDGTGYPDKRKATDTPLAARIMAISDVYDALTSRRCYKEAFAHDRSMEIIREGSGSHFDPALVNAFFAIQDRIQEARELYADGPHVHETRHWESGLH